MKAALESLDSQIDARLSCDVSELNLCRSLKARLEQAKEATANLRQQQNTTLEECAHHARRLSFLKRTEKELEDFRNQSLIEDSAYQELRI